MNKQEESRLWPFKSRTAIIASMVTLVILTLIVAFIRKTIGWPTVESDTVVLVGIFVLSLLPILLVLIDNIIEHGAKIEAGGVKIDFSQVPQKGISGITVPVNIGVSGQPITDSSTTQILDSLRQATANDIVVIDLEEGQAWWETRLLVLLAGAVRLRKPEKVVFVGTDGGIDRRFQGWGYSSDLLRCLLQAHPQYPLSYYKAMSAMRQWEMIEPIGAGIVPSFQLIISQGGLASQHPWMAFDTATGLPNLLLAEQLLATDLGVNVEMHEQPRKISLIRLEELFRPVLHKEVIDESWPSEKQISAFFDSDIKYIAATRNGKYSALIARITVLNAIVRSLIEE